MNVSRPTRQQANLRSRIAKRVAEVIVSTLGYSKSRLASARFGSVFSSQFLLDSLLFQLDQATVTITDPEVVRYFMTTSGGRPSDRDGGDERLAGGLYPGMGRRWPSSISWRRLW